MKPLRQSSIDDLASLQMENELLMHEIRFLRARVASAERALANATAAQRAAAKPATPPKAGDAREACEPPAEGGGACEGCGASEGGDAASPLPPRIVNRPPRPRSKPESRAGHVAVEEAHRQTEEDLRWLLRRLDESSLGFLLRRKQGFRTLLSRYPHQP